MGADRAHIWGLGAAPAAYVSLLGVFLCRPLVSRECRCQSTGWQSQELSSVHETPPTAPALHLREHWWRLNPHSVAHASDCCSLASAGPQHSCPCLHMALIVPASFTNPPALRLPCVIGSLQKGAGRERECERRPQAQQRTLACHKIPEGVVQQQSAGGVRPRTAPQNGNAGDVHGTKPLCTTKLIHNTRN
jgi:hypothetical protein